jgi:hypothetical protein
VLSELAPRCSTVSWNEELVLPLDPKLGEWMTHFDLMCLNNTMQLSGYQELGVRRVEFVMSGFSKSVHSPLVKEGPQPYDVVYVGSPGEDGGRGKMVLRAAQRHRVDVFGRGWEAYRGVSVPAGVSGRGASGPGLRIHGPVRPKGFARICAQAKITLGMNWLNNVPMYFSNRTWMSLGCRAFHLTHYVPGLERVFEDGVHLCWFRDLDEMMERIDEYLDDDVARRRIAKAGYHQVRDAHTYEHRTEQMLHLLTAPVVVAGPQRSSPIDVIDRSASHHAVSVDGTHGAGHGSGNGVARDLAAGALSTTPPLPVTDDSAPGNARRHLSHENGDPLPKARRRLAE